MDIDRWKHVHTVGTTAAPNLANRGKRAGKFTPLSQILTPPVMDPESGFTSVRIGVCSPSALEVEIACPWTELRSGSWAGRGSGTGGLFLTLDKILKEKGSRHWATTSFWPSSSERTMSSLQHGQAWGAVDTTRLTDIPYHLAYGISGSSKN
jgi:hypothetical protein